MKKIVLFLLLALMGVNVGAQEKLPFDEVLLEGDWLAFGEVSELSTGSYYHITKLQFRTEGPTIVFVRHINQQIDIPLNYSHFFISNDNKLHLIALDESSTTQYFVIRDFYIREEDNTPILVLARYNSTFYQNFCFRKISTMNSIADNVISKDTIGSKFDLKGIYGMGDKGIYIQDGKKHIAK